MIRGPRHENILAEREQIVNVSFHVGPNGCGLASDLTILLAMHVGSSIFLSAPSVKFAMTSFR